MEPRTIKPEDIEAYVKSEHYFNAHDAVSLNKNGERIAAPEELTLLTFCVVVLKNGFTLTGISACADPRKYNKEIGEKVARADALNKAWPLMGYVLRSQLAGMSGLLEPEGFKDRVRAEARDLESKLAKLSEFLQNDMGGIAPIDQASLFSQQKAMQDYLDVLKDRINRFYPVE